MKRTTNLLPSLNKRTEENQSMTAFVRYHGDFHADSSIGPDNFSTQSEGEDTRVGVSGLRIDIETLDERLFSGTSGTSDTSDTSAKCKSCRQISSRFETNARPPVAVTHFDDQNDALGALLGTHAKNPVRIAWGESDEGRKERPSPVMGDSFAFSTRRTGVGSSWSLCASRITDQRPGKSVDKEHAPSPPQSVSNTGKHFQGIGIASLSTSQVRVSLATSTLLNEDLGCFFAPLRPRADSPDDEFSVLGMESPRR